MRPTGGAASRLPLRRDLPAIARGARWGRRPGVPDSAREHPAPRIAHLFPTAWARTPAAGAVRTAVQQTLLFPLVHAEVTMRVHGADLLESLPAPVLFAARHASHLDTAVLLAALPRPWRRRTVVGAAADYFFDSAWRGAGTALLFGTFPVQRRGGAPATTAADLLEQGWNVVIFPEGSRSVDGWGTRLRPGVAYLAHHAGVPIVPVVISGTFRAMPRGRSWPLPGRPPVTVRFGTPLRPAETEAPRDLLRRLESALAELAEEETSTWWQARRRAVAGTSANPTGPPAARWRRTWAATAPPGGGSADAPGLPGDPWA